MGHFPGGGQMGHLQEAHPHVLARHLERLGDLAQAEETGVVLDGVSDALHRDADVMKAHLDGGCFERRGCSHTRFHSGPIAVVRQILRIVSR